MKVTQIVTHNGVFHADDVFAVAVLSALYLDAEVVRTRDPQLLAPQEGRVVVDVGGVYDPTHNLFDHHQREGRRPPRENGIPYAGFGLVWGAFGAHMVRCLAYLTGTLSDAVVGRVVAAIDRSIVSSIDAADNGFPLTSIREGFEGCGMGLSASLSQLNPSWMGGSLPDVAFRDAVAIATVLLRAAIVSAVGAEMAVEVVQRHLDNRTDPRVLLLEEFCPWQDTCVQDPDVLYVMFPAETNDTWMVQCVPPTRGSFDKRKALPEKWAGLRDAELATLTGVTDAVFCHPGRFIAGARSKGGALKLLELALAE